MPKADGIIVPTDKVQGFCDFKIIQPPIAKAHHVVRDKVIGAFGTQNVNLLLLKTFIGRRYEAPEIECQGWVGRRSKSRKRQGNLFPFTVNVAPKNCSPACI